MRSAGKLCLIVKLYVVFFVRKSAFLERECQITGSIAFAPGTTPYPQIRQVAPVCPISGNLGRVYSHPAPKCSFRAPSPIKLRCGVAH